MEISDGPAPAPSKMVRLRRLRLLLSRYIPYAINYKYLRVEEKGRLKLDWYTLPLYSHNKANLNSEYHMALYCQTELGQ